MKLPDTIVRPPRKGPRTQRQGGAGFHASTPNRQRARGAAKRAAIADQTRSG